MLRASMSEARQKANQSPGFSGFGSHGCSPDLLASKVNRPSVIRRDAHSCIGVLDGAHFEGS